ncbi:diaminopimelate decarboxylase [Metapseudomonas lalkuanensis]|uniref:Diaminopimelate decarboxylase n=1 Tax=Metapseudomonas lalkuanensis TaxID=2604832 RepID=A0A5J6QGB4_9GAMM|nr:diaminopimelate decarboxylase [Pseudomonas lalkuanensis]QEY61604.1 diaminopimelate decarboxylase [Pseudomonas lalkuanensis]UCO99368.1 diaminopimelate decarboxylase [Pseudomonas lalkuanensis]
MRPNIPAATLAMLAREHGTPLWCYDAAVIRERIAQLKGFDVIRFAQKACSNLSILRLMREEGVQVDAVSLGEIERALLAGYSPKGEPAGVVLTCDLLDRPTLQRAVELGIEVNVGSIDMLTQLGQASPGHRVWLRINPGFGHGHSQKTNTGGENSKHGIWHSQLDAAMAVIRDYGLVLVGLHMHIGSGVDYSHLEEVCGAMVGAVRELGSDLEAISAGGGLSIPYRDGDPVVDIPRYAELWNQARREVEGIVGHPVRLELEPGRFLVAESGCLLSEVRAVKDVGNNHFILVDAGFNDLMRPSMYGSFHGMSLLDAAGNPSTAPQRQTVVAGPLCESGDVFTQHDGGLVAPRALPAAQVGDLLLIHDTGAYGASMSSNYNSRPLLPEVLVDGDDVRLIRRRQPLADLLALEL